MAEAASTAPETTEPPLTEEGTGFALLSDGYPVNLRLRAERLSADGKASDEAGHVTDEQIIQAGERMAAERAAAEEAEKAKDLSRKSHAELDVIAAEEGVDLAGATLKDDKVEAIEAHREATEGNS